MALFGLFSKKLKDKGWFHPLLYPLSWFDETYLDDATGNTAPNVALNTPADASNVADTTPTLEFTGTDAEGEEIEYQVQIDTVNTFDSQGSETFATGNPLDKNAAITLTGGDLIATATNASVQNIRGTIGRAAGSGLKIYFEGKVKAAITNSISFGVQTSAESLSALCGDTTAGYGYNDVGQKKHNGVDTAYGGTPVLNDIIRCCLDLQNNEVTFGLNATMYAVAFTGLSGTFYAGWSSGFGANSIEFNFGDTTFAFTPPTGFNDRFSNMIATGPLLNKISETDAGFLNTINGGDTHPFASADKISYTVQAGDALPLTTYYWRVRGKDVTGTNEYGAWSSTRSFTVVSGGGGSSIKTVLGLIKSSVKTWNNLPNANIKTINNLP